MVALRLELCKVYEPIQIIGVTKDKSFQYEISVSYEVPWKLITSSQQVMKV